jgi:hypothetical protein
MKKIYLLLQKRIEKDLNEYIKWVFLIGLYGFYRMLAITYDEKQLAFLVIPLIFIAICVFISDWIIEDLVRTAENPEERMGDSRPLIVSWLVTGLFYLSILLFVLFYLVDWVPLVNLGLLGLLGAAMAARFQDASTPGQEQTWNRWASLVLATIGLAGSIHAIIFNNQLNVLSFVFYIACMVYYYLNLYLYNKKPDKKDPEL